jgi:hypothetical protein
MEILKQAKLVNKNRSYSEDTKESIEEHIKGISSK